MYSVYNPNKNTSIDDVSNTDNTYNVNGTNDISNSHNAPISPPLLMNASNIPVSASANPGSVQPVHMSTNTHAMTHTLPPYDIRRVLSSNQTRNTSSIEPTSTPPDISSQVYESSDGHR